MAATDTTEPVSVPVVAELQKPKKALSAYFLFTNKMRPEVMQENRDQNGGKVKFGEIAKAISARWTALPAEAKKEFEVQAEEEKKRHAKELLAFLEATDLAGTLRKKYEHLMPKKPASAYFVFAQDPAQREKAVESLKAAGAETAIKHVASKLGEMWKAAAADVKAPFETSAKEAQAEFLKKQKEWQATPEFAEIEKAATKQAEDQKVTAGENASEVTPVKMGKRKSLPGVVYGKTESPPEKKPKTSPKEKSTRVAKSKAQVDMTIIEEDVLAEAGKLDMVGALRNLAGRPEVVASGKTSRQIFAALQASEGLVNVAKRALTEVASGAGA